MVFLNYKIYNFSLILLFIFIPNSLAIILSGAPNSYARYPKWAHSYENTLSFEFKTKQTNGLLLYTDDSGVNGNFYSISIADGRLQLDFRLGDNSNDLRDQRSVTSIRIEEVRVDDGRWHTLRLHQSFENVKMELDYTLVFKILNQRSFVFGNIHKNSDVFVGGLPPDVHMLTEMSSPLRRYSRHISINLRNLVYRLYPQGETSPQLLDGYGVRQNEDDYCRATGFSSRELFQCQHGGVCFSSHEGPQCDCTMSDYEGKHCEIEKSDGELTFSGEEWLGYDVSKNNSGPVRYRHEYLNITFKTVHGNQMLFYSGDEKNYLHLMLEDGAIIVSSKFEGTDVRMIRMFNSYPAERYDDDSWHNVYVDRTLQLNIQHTEKISAVHMTLSIDGRRDEIRQYAPELDWIENSFAYLGGLPKHLAGHHAVNRIPYRGCMKLIDYSMDSIQLKFVTLADQGYGQSIIQSGGELSFSCKNPYQPADVLSFHPGSQPIKIDKYHTDNKGGSLSFQFRTTDPDGLLYYHASLVDNSSEYIAFELSDGHLFLIIDLGAGPIRLQTTSKKISDSNDWHNIYMERMRRTGSVIVDNQKIDFHTPGTSANLDVVDPVFVGGIPHQRLIFPSSVWSFSLRKSFSGCVKNLRFNGINAKIASVFENSNTTGVSLGCPSPSIDSCSPNPCLNYGRCSMGTLSFVCDCSGTGMEGKLCNMESNHLQLDGEISLLTVMPQTVQSEAEQIEIKFKTDAANSILLETKSNRKQRDCIQLSIRNAELHLELRTSTSNHSFSWGTSLKKSSWHEVKVKRRGSHLLLFLDGKWGRSYFLPSSLVVELDEIVGAQSFSQPNMPQFKGLLSNMEFNGIDLLEKRKKLVKTSKEQKGQRNIKSKLSSISFTNTTGFVLFSQEKISSFTGSFRLSFKFQTLIRSALLFATLSATNNQNIVIQLINSRIRYSYIHNGVEHSISSPKLANKGHLSDMRWHTLLVYQDSRTSEHILMVDNTTSSMPGNGSLFRLMSEASLGGLPVQNTISLSPYAPQSGFRGCISTLRINERNVDMMEDAEKYEQIEKGCSGPLARCSPSACSYGGRCIQQWNSIRCDCSLTARAGDRCQDTATTVSFTGAAGAVYYEYPDGEMPSTSKDWLVLGFQTKHLSGVLYSVECSADEDYMVIYMNKGYLEMKYNLGSGNHHLGVYDQTVSDGEFHTVKMIRSQANVTLQVDSRPAVRLITKDSSELVTLNMQWRLVMGAAFTPKHLDDATRQKREEAAKLYDPFVGEISGVNFNGIQILELLAQGSSRVHTIGVVQKTSISPAIETKGEDIMYGEHYASDDSLIESIAPGCLTIEEQDSCYIQTESNGFFTPVLPSSVTTARRVTGAPPSAYTTNKPTTSTKPTEVPDLSDMDILLYEGSANLPIETQATTVTQPQTTTTTTTTPKPRPTTPKTRPTTTTVPTTPASTPRPTVLPRPYESVSKAAEENPEYLGESIWADVDLLPEPMVTGPAWRTHLMNTTTPPTKPTKKHSAEREERTTAMPKTTPPRKIIMPEPTKKTTILTTTERTTAFTTFTTLLSTTAKISTKSKTTPSFAIHAVRPTTPMGDLVTSTMKYDVSGDFPKTAMVMISSVVVVILIAFIVFCVFKCRQNPPPEHYAMQMNGKPHAGGYTAISSDMSPPLGIDPSTQPLLGKKPQMNGNGYQPLKGSVIPNGNGYTNGNGIRNVIAKKKDFKEWYV